MNAVSPTFEMPSAALVLSVTEFAVAVGVSDRAARKAFQNRSFRGHHLPVVQVPGQRGGAGGMVWGLALNRATPELRALLKLPETLPSTPVERRLKGRPDDRHITTAVDKQRIIAPIVAHPKGSHERAEAYRDAAGQQHLVGSHWSRFTERTLRDWVQSVEDGGPAALMPAGHRRDKGRIRAQIARDWHKGCGLPEDVQSSIAKALEKTARGMILKGRSDRNTRVLCQTELARMSREAGVDLPQRVLLDMCRLSSSWVTRWREMKPVHLHDRDHKTYTDRHEFHVRRTLTALPMEVLYGDVHHVDLSIAEAIVSQWKVLRRAAKKAQKDGLLSIRVSLIGWLDGSSHYLWATPVILGPGQGITQQDVTRSLHEVFACPYGGVPRKIVIDNGSEYKALADAVTRFCAMGDMGHFGVVHCRPYGPEGKGRLEGAFGILEKTFLSALPGYIAGDRMKSPTKSKGKRIDPYPHGPERLLSDLHLAVLQFNGTAQHGDLAGLSPKAMLEAKIHENDWKADRIKDEAMFDLVFSRSEHRDVIQGSISIGGRRYSGDVLATLTGAKQVEFLVPIRDPEGPVICWQDGVIHWLKEETFDLNDRNGARRKGELVKLEKSEIDRRRALADQNVDVQAMLTAAADCEPVQFNPPNEWSMGSFDKAGVLGGTITQEAAEVENRDFLKEYLASKREVGRGASGGNRNSPSCAT